MSKRLRTTYDGSVKDYISDLLDELISDILSRLSTKDAVRTSVLSRNWKCKWTSIYNVDIDEESKYFSRENADANFSSVVTGLLFRIQTLRLRRFRLELSGEPCHSSLLGTWIYNVLRRKVRNMHIKAVKYQRLDSQWCFSGWTCLTDLRLVMSCTLKVPSENCFPNLKNLILGGGIHGNIKVITTKVPGTAHVVLLFPVLVVLRFWKCEFLDVTSMEIQAPKLILFNVFTKVESNNYEIKLCAPKLVMFELVKGGCLNNYVLSASPTTTYASLLTCHYEETSALRAHNILTKFSNLKCLRIHGKILQGLLRLKPKHFFPKFNMLKELEIDLSCVIEDVLELLQILPPLEILVISVFTLAEYEFGEALTPKILSQLKEVKLLCFSATKGQNHLATYFLKNATSLRKMTVTLLKKPVEAVSQSLSELKLQGPSCEIVVVEQKYPNVWAWPIPIYVGNEDK